MKRTVGKTAWSWRYVSRHCERPTKWIAAKRLLFEAVTGVPWSYTLTGDQLAFMPCLKAGKINHRLAYPWDREAVMAILNEAPRSKDHGFVFFLDLAGKMGLPLVSVMAAVKMLWIEQKLWYRANPRGDVVAVRSR